MRLPGLSSILLHIFLAGFDKSIHCRRMKEKRISEILGWLAAYRNEWIAYDREHVLALKSELAQLSR